MFQSSIFDDIRDGHAVLVTGAGVSAGARNRFTNSIIGSAELAKLIAQAADLEYVNEDIKEVFDAIGPTLGSAKIKRIFEQQFLQTSPSKALVRAFGVPWRRVYTFNVDDTIENIKRKDSAQRLRFYNALKDRREEWRGFSECQVIHLHGYAGDPESGFIFSSIEYADAAARNPAWYSQLGEDFIDYTVVFVGTSLKENLLFQSVRGALTKDLNPGRSFCVTPDDLTAIQARSLDSRGIIHIKGTLEDFANEIDRRFPGGLRPRDVEISGTAAEGTQKNRYTDKDVEALRAIFPVSAKNIAKRFPKERSDTSKFRRRFYEGYGPTWPIVSAGAYANLTQYSDLSSSIDRARLQSRGVVVLGEAGSGKSTFVMHYGLSLAASGGLVFEYTEGSASFRETMYSLKKYREDRPCAILVDDLHVLADEISDVLSDNSMEGATVITSARTGEWHGRIEKLFGKNIETVRLERFRTDDVGAIIAAIEENVAAPAFNRLDDIQKRDRFLRSRQQLLIAMLEATESKGFTEIIEDEFGRINNTDQKLLLLAVAVATIPRIGISKSMASTILASIKARLGFDELSQGLKGIVDQTKSGRFQARHQVYASEVVQKFAKLEDLEIILRAMVEYYTKFSAPIIKTITKHDGQLFKY